MIEIWDTVHGTADVERRGIGCPLPCQLGHLEEHRKLPSGVRGAAPAENGFSAF